MPTQIKLPSLGEGVESADVLSILVGEGDTISPEQDIIEIETEKATVPVPASAGGRVTKILVSQGDTIETGTPLLEIEPSEDGGEEKEKPAGRKEKPAAEEKKPAEREKEPEPDEEEEPEETAEEPEEEEEPPKKAEKRPREEPAKAADRPKQKAAQKTTESEITALPKVGGETPGDGQSATAASPSVRRLARQLGVDLRRIRATGEGGRITTDDVTAYVRQANRRLDGGAAQKDLPGEPDADDWGPVRRERMTRLRQTIGRTMTRSYTTIPQLTNFDDADITELEDLREESKDDYARTGVKLTTMPFLIKAAASALKKNPIVNASVDTESNEIIYKEYVNVGIAVDTERGLIVPVLRDADRMNIPQIAAELARIGEMAKGGKYTLDDLKGGTFTISNLGSIGGTYSTPIINPPEAAILLTGRSRILPMYIDGQLRPRLMLPLSLTYDHRIVDGAAAARFLNEVKAYLTAPGRLLLAP